MLSTKHIEEELEAFKRYVIQQSKSNLSKQKKNSSKKLYNSIDAEYKVSKNSFSLDFLMEEHGIYQDKGVRGVGGVRKTTSKFNKSNNAGKMWKQKGGNSPFSFKAGKKPSAKHFEKWAKSKGISPFAVSYAVWKQGIKPSLFFTKPFEKGFNRLDDKLIEAFGLDVEEFLNHTLKEIKFK